MVVLICQLFKKAICSSLLLLLIGIIVCVAHVETVQGRNKIHTECSLSWSIEDVFIFNSSKKIRNAFTTFSEIYLTSGNNIRCRDRCYESPLRLDNKTRFFYYLSIGGRKFL